MLTGLYLGLSTRLVLDRLFISFLGLPSCILYLPVFLPPLPGCLTAFCNSTAGLPIRWTLG